VCDLPITTNKRKPYNLENYQEDRTINGYKYTAIKPRLEKMRLKVEELKTTLNSGEKKSKDGL